MPLAAGDKLGPYEILALIGEGGMGTVHRARDPRLNRDVAIKVSAERFSERFEREARAIAALNHPNICTLYDVGPNYLVMEFVEGESPSGPMPLDEVLGIARQISDALDAAHDKGIVHRDLKPANIKIKPDGTVKVLDFGLAKMGGTPPTPSENSPTISMAATQAGVILGTAAYMSPEQARGKVADKRADVWAFGVVLYELLTGKRLFQGEDLTETLASVVKEQPDLSAAPAKVRRLLRACLEKDPKKRLQSAGDWKLLIEEDAPAVAAPSRSRLGLLPWAAAAVFAIGAGMLALVHFRETPPVRQTLRFHIPAPDSRRIGGLQISPNGRYLAMMRGFGAGADSRITIQAFDELEPRVLAGTEGATYPFWAPDSAHLGFFADGKLKKIALAGGPPTTLCDAADGRGGTWTDNDGGVILFSPGPTRPIMRVSSAGGDPKQVAALPSGGRAEGHRFPSFLPDGMHFFYSSGSDDANVRGLWVGSLKGDAPVRLLPDITQGMYAPPAEAGAMGHLLFLREQATLMAQPFDPAQLKLAGEAIPLVEEVAQGGNTGFGAFAVGGAGLLIYREGNENGRRQLVWLDRSGKRLDQVTQPAAMGIATLAPDEKRLALTQGGRVRNDLWLQQVGSDAPERFTSLPGVIGSHVFEPSGARVAFGVRPPGQTSSDIYVKPVSGGKEELLHHGGVNVALSDWSPDGKFIVFQENFAGTAEDLWLLPLDGDHKPIPYLRTPAGEINARFAPDGLWMAYTSNEGGTQQVWVQDIPATGKKFQISTVGGNNPLWRRDGKELYYGEGGDYLAVPITLGATVQRGAPQHLFPRANVTLVAASRDGQRFLAAVPEGAAPVAPPITVVTNWQAGMKK